MMGIGPGAAPPDFEMFGVVDKDRMAMLEESIDMIIKLWTTTRPTTSAASTGRPWSRTMSSRISAWPRSPSPTSNPIRRSCCPASAAAPRAPASRPAAAGNRSRPISSPRTSPRPLARLLRRTKKARARAGARTNIAFGRTLLVTETDEEADTYLHAPGNALEWYFHYIIGLTSHGGFVGMLKARPRHARFSGDAPLLHRQHGHRRQSRKTVAEKLAAFREDTAPFETLTTSHHDWDDETMWRRHMYLLSHEVMPILRDLTGTKHLVEQRQAAE